jgi:hypothetical protein
MARNDRQRLALAFQCLACLPACLLFACLLQCKPAAVTDRLLAVERHMAQPSQSLQIPTHNSIIWIVPDATVTALETRRGVPRLTARGGYSMPVLPDVLQILSYALLALSS